MNPIPVNTPTLAGNELKYVTDCIQSGWISSEGPYVKKFEDAFSSYVDRKEGIAVSSGSAALDIAIQALEITNGDEVIMPAFTIISPAFSIVRAGAVPVLIDADPSTWNMDVTKIQQRITSKTKAILVVHIYGLPVDMQPVIELAKTYKLKIIEDAAEAHGLQYNGKSCGSFGDVSIFSFYPNKLITTGEGGMIVTNDAIIADRCRKYRNLAFEPAGRRFVHSEMGWNYRLTNIQAALGLAQLERADEHLAQKKQIGKAYRVGLKNLNGFQQPVHSTQFAENVYWVYGLVADSQIRAEETVDYLTQRGIGTRPFFWSMHEQPVFRQKGLFINESYPVAETLSRNGFYLPSGLGLLNDQQQDVIRTLLEIHG